MKKPAFFHSRIRRAMLALVLALLLLMPVTGLSQEPGQSLSTPLQAPRRLLSTEEFPPGTGFRPPEMDLSHLTGQRLPAESAPLQLPAVWDWRTQGGGRVTPVKDQGNCGSCYAFAAIANIESKMLMDAAGTWDFSENNAKECNWRELNNYQSGTWGSCMGGNYEMLVSLFSTKGTVLESCDPYVASDVACKSSCAYQKTLTDWRIISGNAMPDTDTLKQYIYTYGPIYTSMYVDSSHGFNGSYDGSWTFNYAGPGTSTNHAVLIVGWSNALPPVPGGKGPADGWIVKNSWGPGWGASGYFYMTYGAGNLGLYSSFMHGWKNYDANGSILYYDDDGWTTSWGCANPVAWGLAKFVPATNTFGTSIEFWTADSPTTADVYLYDTFDGSSPSNLLASVVGNTFNEAGYHAVPLNPGVSLTGGNDVFAVVKFTDNSYGYPIPGDVNGSIQPKKYTYLSCSGLPGSWVDMSTLTPKTDVAIRLRTSNVPTAVSLARFEATPQGNAIHLEWETATELDNLGFNLYRSHGSDGERSLLNSVLIPDQAGSSPIGAVYTWLDEGVRPGITYSYWLEAVDIYGAATLHGPVKATAPMPRFRAPIRPRPTPQAVSPVRR
jgi:C1A family cysteine protease